MSPRSCACKWRGTAAAAGAGGCGVSRRNKGLGRAQRCLASHITSARRPASAKRAVRTNPQVPRHHRPVPASPQHPAPGLQAAASAAPCRLSAAQPAPTCSCSAFSFISATALPASPMATISLRPGRAARGGPGAYAFRGMLQGWGPALHGSHAVGHSGALLPDPLLQSPLGPPGPMSTQHTVTPPHPARAH